MELQIYSSRNMCWIKLRMLFVLVFLGCVLFSQSNLFAEYSLNEESISVKGYPSKDEKRVFKIYEDALMAAYEDALKKSESGGEVPKKVKAIKKDWFFFHKLDEKENDLSEDYWLKGNEKSQFLKDFLVTAWSGLTIGESGPALFANINKGYYPHMIGFNADHGSFETGCGKIWTDAEKVNPFYAKALSTFIKELEVNLIKEYSLLTSEELEKMHQEALRGVACKYKIHLQVDPEYLISFVEDLCVFFVQDPQAYLIPFFKVSSDPFLPSRTRTEDPVPMIVLYVCSIPGDAAEKHKILNPLVHAIVERYKNVAQEISLKRSDGSCVRPRFNSRVFEGNDLVWIAGGNADDKIIYRALLKPKDENILLSRLEFVYGELSVRGLISPGLDDDIKNRGISRWNELKSFQEVFDKTHSDNDKKVLKEAFKIKTGIDFDQVERFKKIHVLLKELTGKISDDEKTKIKERLEAELGNSLEEEYKKIYLPENTVYTDDYSFFKGYEFKYDPKEEEGKSINFVAAKKEDVLVVKNNQAPVSREFGVLGRLQSTCKRVWVACAKYFVK
ncbi:MAG: hypothetical protein ABH827_01260 [bacterium]